jgi:hypothetical protein
MRSLNDEHRRDVALRRRRSCSAAQHAQGLGYDLQVLEAIQAETRQITPGQKVAEVKTLRAHGGDRKSTEYAHNALWAD